MSVALIREGDECVDVFIDGNWAGTFGCEEKDVSYVFKILVKWYENIAKGKWTPSPVPLLLLSGIITWYSNEPGEEMSLSEEDEDEV